MPTSAEIGVSASNYTGNENLGVGSFGAVKLDTRPIEDLAKYTMLYNKAEYDQRQKDAEAAAKEIADYTSYDLTTGIPKDAKLLQEKYDKLIAYANNNPKATDYRNKKEWAEYKKMRNDLENDLRGAKVRNTMNMLREKRIAEESEPELKKLYIQELQSDIEKTDIRTPLPHDQQYATPDIKMPSPQSLKFDVTIKDANGIWNRTEKIFDVSKARANSGVFTILDKIEGYDASTPEGKRAAISRKNNFWVQGSEVFNSVLSNPAMYKTATDSTTGKTTVTGELDESKLPSTARGLYNLAKQTNKYLAKVKADIKAGNYKDKLGNGITFGDGALNESDYAEINVNDGISPEELAFIAQYATAESDEYATKYQQTDDANQAAARAVQRRGQDIGLLNDREQRGLTKWIAENKPSAATGTASQQLAEYPIMKTDELVNAIGDKGTTFSQLTAEQQEKVKKKIVGINDKDLPNAVITINGDLITVKSGNSVSKINADDITKTYYDEINSNDAGKENVQRIYYDRTKTKQPASGESPEERAKRIANGG